MNDATRRKSRKQNGSYENLCLLSVCTTHTCFRYVDWRTANDRVIESRACTGQGERSWRDSSGKNVEKREKRQSVKCGKKVKSLVIGGCDDKKGALTLNECGNYSISGLAGL